MSEAVSEFQTLHEIAKAAKKNLSLETWDYLVGGTESETTLKRNRQSLDAVAFRPRVMRDVTHVDCSTDFLGKTFRIPVALAPIGSLESFEAGGGATSARASGEFNVPHILSSVCKPGLEETAAAADNPRIFQLYVRGDDDFVDDYVRRAVDHGYYAFCITVDSASYSRRERDIAKRYVKPWRQGVKGAEYQSGFTWDNVKRFKDKHDIPLILKGIATAEDAAIACEHGVDVIYVSNHGGRQLDHGRGAMDVLPEVVAEVGGEAKIMIDGGFLRGSDVVKAIAAGADLVGLGRLQGFGLAAAGQDGLMRALKLLEDEIRICLALLGVTNLDALDGSYLHRATPVDPPHALSAFPLLEEGY